MATHYAILPEEQRRLLPSLAPLAELGFVLYGGTAIALQIGHRGSVEFDFFTDRRMNQDAMRTALPILAEAVTLREQPDGWSVKIHPNTPERAVKLSFFAGLGFGRVGRPIEDDEGTVLMASLNDLLGHKLMVLLQRVETKDYRDIAGMLRAGKSLDRGLGAAMALFPNFPPCEALKALVYFDDANLSDLLPEDRATLIAHADEVASPRPLPILSRSLSDIALL